MCVRVMCVCVSVFVVRVVCVYLCVQVVCDVHVLHVTIKISLALPTNKKINLVLH